MKKKRKGIICYANYDKQYHVYHYLPILFLFNLIKIILFPFKFIIPNQRHIKRLYKLSFHTNIDNNIKELHKLCFLSTPNKLASFTDEITKKYPDYIFYPVNQKATELVHKSVGKYQALSWITKNKGYCLENVMAFGDSGNDQELLTYAGIGVAMKNAILETSKVTPYHTDLDNEEDGVYNYLLKTIKKA